jgi:Domain of unknown function (DUF4430)
VTRALGTAAVAVLCAATAAGCGLGGGKRGGDVELTITRYYGTELVVREDEPVSESDSVMRVLDRAAEVETRYGGGFVQSIDGLAGGQSAGRRSDWFFYVNGIESPVGAAEFEVTDGDRVWWDYRDWTSAMRVPAVVGSWPEPFAHGFRGERYPTELRCKAASAVCGLARDRLADAGADVSGPEEGEESIVVLVGVWNRIRGEEDARLLEQGPERSGVFATLTGPGRGVLTVLNARAEPAGSIGRDAGLIAALRPGEGPPTWVVTGLDADGLQETVELLGDPLRDRYALAVDEVGPIGVPTP